MARKSGTLAQRVDSVTQGVRTRRRRAPGPRFGKLEKNVDAVLLSRGLELNAAPEKLLERTRRGGLFAADGARVRKGEKTIRRNIRRFKARRRKRPARGKQLRAAKRKGRGK